MVDHFCVRKEVSPKVGGRAGRGLSLTVTPGDAAVSEGGGYRKGRGAPPPAPPRRLLLAAVWRVSASGVEGWIPSTGC